VSASATTPNPIISTGSTRPSATVSSAAPTIPAKKIATLNATGKKAFATSALSPQRVR